MRCKAKSMGMLFATAFFLCFMLLFFKPSVAHAAVDATDLSYNMVNHNCLANVGVFHADANQHWQVCKICGRHVNVGNHNIKNQTWMMHVALEDGSTAYAMVPGSSGVISAIPLNSCSLNNQGEVGCTCGVNGTQHVVNTDSTWVKHYSQNAYVLVNGNYIPFSQSSYNVPKRAGALPYGNYPNGDWVWTDLDYNEEYHVWKCKFCRSEMEGSYYNPAPGSDTKYGRVYHTGSHCDVCGFDGKSRGTGCFIYLCGADESRYANESFNTRYAGDDVSYKSYMIRSTTGWNPVTGVSVSRYDQYIDGSFDATVSVYVNTDMVLSLGTSPQMTDMDSGQLTITPPDFSAQLNGHVYTVSVHVDSAKAKTFEANQLRLSIPGLQCGNSNGGTDTLACYLIVNLDNERYASLAGRANDVKPYIDGTCVSTRNNIANTNWANNNWTASKSVYVSAHDNRSPYLKFELYVADPKTNQVVYHVEQSGNTTYKNGSYCVENLELPIPYDLESDELKYTVFVTDASGTQCTQTNATTQGSGSIYKLDPVTPQVDTWCTSNGQQVNGYVDNGEVVQSVADGWSKTKTYGSMFYDHGSGVYRFGIVMRNIYGLTSSQIGSSGSVKFFEMSHDLKDQNRPVYMYPSCDSPGNVIFNGDVYADKDIALMTVDGTGLSCVSRLRLSKIDNTAPTIGIDDIATTEGVDGATVTVHADDINQKLYNRYKSNASLKSQYPDGTSYYVGSGRDGYYFGYSKNSNKTNIKWNTTVYDNDITINDGGYYYVYAKDLAGNISEGKQVWVPIWNKVIFDARGGDGDRGTTDGYFTDASGANIGRYITRWYQWNTTYKDYPATTNGTKPSGNAAFPVPTRVGYTFIGWFKTPQTVTVTHIDASHTSYNSDTSVSGKLATNGSIPHEHTTTLYAHWKANKYTVSFDSNAQNGAGTVTGTMNPMTFTVDVWQKLTPNAFSKVTTGHVVCKNGQLVAIDSAFKGWDRDPMVIRVGDTTPTYADNAYVRNLTYTNNDRVTLYAIWDDSPRFYKDGNGYVHNEYPDRQFSLADAQAGRITEEELLRTVVVYDRESNPMRNKTSADVAATGDMGVTLFNYSADEFTTLTQPANISITYKAKDESDICAYYTITVYVTSNDANASEIRDFVRNISSKYQTLAPEDGGLSSDSWWRTNDFYHSQLESALNGSDTTYEHTFSSDDLNNIREYVERNGFGNAEHDDALQNLYDQYR